MNGTVRTSCAVCGARIVTIPGDQRQGPHGYPRCHDCAGVCHL